MQSLDAPKTWSKPRRVFVNSMSDLFHDDVPIEFIAQVWHVMKETPGTRIKSSPSGLNAWRKF